MNGACNSTFLAPDYKVSFKDFIPNFVCVLTNKRYKTYQTAFTFCHLGHAPGVGLWVLGGQKIVFSQHGHAAYQIEGSDG